MWIGNLASTYIRKTFGKFIIWDRYRPTKQLLNLAVPPLTRAHLGTASKKSRIYKHLTAHLVHPCSTMIRKLQGIFTPTIIDQWWKYMIEISLKALWNDENLRRFMLQTQAIYLQCLSNAFLQICYVINLSVETLPLANVLAMTNKYPFPVPKRKLTNSHFFPPVGASSMLRPKGLSATCRSVALQANGTLLMHMDSRYMPWNSDGIKKYCCNWMCHCTNSITRHFASRHVVCRQLRFQQLFWKVLPCNDVKLTDVYW